MTRALVRGKEIMVEPFSAWVQNNIDFLTGQEKDEEGNLLPGDGWTLVENYEPPEPESEIIPEEADGEA